MRVLALVLPLILLGCIADNKTRQTSQPVTENHVHVPPPAIEIKDVDTDKLVEDAAARVSQNVKTDMATNNAQLSGHIVAQLSKLEMNLKGLINLEAKIDNNMYLGLRADLTSTIQTVATLKASIDANLNVNNDMKATLNNQMKALSDIEIKLGHLSSQLDATAAAQVGLSNMINKMQLTLQNDISAGRDVNMWPMSAVLTVLGIMLIMGGLTFGVTVVIAKRAYDNARAREDDYARLLMAALSDMEPHKAAGIRAMLRPPTGFKPPEAPPVTPGHDQ